MNHPVVEPREKDPITQVGCLLYRYAHNQSLRLDVFGRSEDPVVLRDVLCRRDSVTNFYRQGTVRFGDVVRGEETWRLDRVGEHTKWERRDIVGRPVDRPRPLLVRPTR